MNVAQRFSHIPSPAIRAMVERSQQLEKSGIRVAHLEIGRPAVLEPDDEVLIPEPCWTAYPGIVRLMNAVPRLVPLQANNGFDLDLVALRQAITPRTKALLLNTPHNPTGVILKRPSLDGIAELAQAHDLLIVCDEIYDQICFDGQTPPTIAALPGMQERVALVCGFSKTYSMTGWRIGYVALPHPLVRPALLAHANIMSSVNTFIQYGALAALTGGGPAAALMSAEYQKRRDEAVRLLQCMPDIFLTPGGGSFFLFPRFLTFRDDQQLAQRLLEEAHVATVPGSAFGPTGAGHLRLSVSCDLQSILEGLERMHQWLTARS